MKTSPFLSLVANRTAPRVYIVQALDFSVHPVKPRDGEKPFRMQRIQKMQVLRVLHGPCFYDTREQQLQAMEIATANKRRWPAELVSADDQTYSLGPVDDNKDREPTIYDNGVDDGEAWE